MKSKEYINYRYVYIVVQDQKNEKVVCFTASNVEIALNESLNVRFQM